MSYLNDLLGLLNYRNNQDYGLGTIQLGREQLGEEARQFNTGAQQWQQQEELRRQMEQFRQEQLREQIARQQEQEQYGREQTRGQRDREQAQQNYANYLKWFSDAEQSLASNPSFQASLKAAALRRARANQTTPWYTNDIGMRYSYPVTP